MRSLRRRAATSGIGTIALSQAANAADSRVACM
jgi:hypothetical protein